MSYSLNTPSCNLLNKQSNNQLLGEWESCINDQRTRGDTQQEKQQNMLKECCNLVLQCKKPNEWLKSNWDDNKYNLYCPTPKKIDHPHFGDIKPADGVM